ncbi:MAG: AAA family ATPase [Parachlamydiaceae bacterium]
MKIREVFKHAISQAPCVLFMDEIDEIASKRQTNSLGHEAHNEEITELITQIDKALAANVILIGATNRFEALDPAVI